MKFKVGDRVQINPITKVFCFGECKEISDIQQSQEILEIINCDTKFWYPRYVATPTNKKHMFSFDGDELVLVNRGHPHAKAMAQYAEDAKTSEQPWELWQLQTISGQWLNCTVPVAWNPDKRYRRKPAAYVVNGFEVPAQKWQPIKTIPGNSCTRILLSDGKRIWAPGWHAAMYRDGTDASGWAGQEHATHWMPMPDLPNEG